MPFIFPTGKDAILDTGSCFTHGPCRPPTPLSLLPPFLLNSYSRFLTTMRFNWVSSGVAAASLLVFSALPAAARECLISAVLLQWGLSLTF